MKNLKKKLKKQEGFTLIEMLIVVAIIAILIAISIPLVGQALERARESTDAANERSFKAELTICYLTEDLNGSGSGGGSVTAFVTGKTYYYNAATGKLQDADTGITEYGKGTASGDDSMPRAGGILQGSVSEDGDVTIKWNNDTGTQPTLTSDILMKG